MPTNSRFAVAPSNIDIKRNGFDIPYNHKTTGNFGDIIPFFWQEVVPGDSFDFETAILSRMSTPLFPVADNAYLNYYYFFIPNRLVWSHWAEFLGENKYSAWVSDTEYFIPRGEGIVPERGSVYDHLGVPTYDADMLPAAMQGRRPAFNLDFLLPRAYHLVYNEWFRNQNTNDPILVNTGDSVDQEEIDRFQKLCKAAKPFDVFTSGLPAPQKGNAVDIPLSGNAPVVTSNTPTLSFNTTPLMFDTWGSELNAGYLGIQNNRIVNESNGVRGVDINLALSGSGTGSTIGGPLNLFADLSRVNAATINQLRMAFQMQKLLELQARSGSRYTEIIKASFGVTSPDARLQRPEYLGGSKVFINVSEVKQQSATTETSPLGHVGASSKTAVHSRDFSASFTEHGFILGVIVARHDLSYQQGLHPMWSRRSRYDFYWPTFSCIGEQPVKRSCLFATGDPENDDQVFNYQEAWWDYRFKPNDVTGAFRSTVNGNLDEWHYADYYDRAPVFSAEWMNASAVNVDRTLAVTSAVHDQLIFDIRVNMKSMRPIPVYSVPGLIDHF